MINDASTFVFSYSSLDNVENIEYSPTEMRLAGFSVTQMNQGGFSYRRLRDAGYHCIDISDDLKATLVELRDAGYTPGG